MQSGFSLFELIIVIALIAAIATFSVTLTDTAVRGQEFTRVRETIAQELTAARNDTVAGTRDAAWGVAFSSNAITRFQGTTFATRNATLDRATQFGNEVMISGASEIDFVRPAGTPTASTTILLSNGIRSARITVTETGALEMY